MLVRSRTGTLSVYRSTISSVNVSGDDSRRTSCGIAASSFFSRSASINVISYGVPFSAKRYFGLAGVELPPVGIRRVAMTKLYGEHGFGCQRKWQTPAGSDG